PAASEVLDLERAHTCGHDTVEAPEATHLLRRRSHSLILVRECLGLSGASRNRSPGDLHSRDLWVACGAPSRERDLCDAFGAPSGVGPAEKEGFEPSKEVSTPLTP